MSHLYIPPGRTGGLTGWQVCHCRVSHSFLSCKYFPIYICIIYTYLFKAVLKCKQSKRTKPTSHIFYSYLKHACPNQCCFSTHYNQKPLLYIFFFYQILYSTFVKHFTKQIYYFWHHSPQQFIHPSSLFQT